jgi:hypothetical protein
MSAITVEQSAAWYESRGLTLGEQTDDEPTYCGECGYVIDPDDLADLDGQRVCVPCLVALTGDDVRGVDSERDL